MQINLTNKEINELRRLRNRLNSELIPVKQIRDFIAGLEQKLEKPSASPALTKRIANKTNRVEKYRTKLRIA